MPATTQANGSPALMRAINAAHVVRELRAAGPMSRASLVRATGLSKPTITNVVAYLEGLRYIGSVATSARTPLYAYRADRGVVLGIDIGADKGLVLLADLAGTVIGSARVNTRAIAAEGPDRIVRELAEAAAGLVGDLEVLSVVVGTPGIVSASGVVTMAPQLAGWEGLDLAAAFAGHFRCEVTIESEVSLSLEAERWVGGARGIDDALFINLGVGVAAGLLVGGQIYRGADGAAGEIGTMPLPRIDADGRTTLTSLESVAGGGALRRRGQELALSAEGAGLLAAAGGAVADVDASVVFAAARAGDPASVALVDDVVTVLAWGISCLVCALNPTTVVIGGGLSRSADLFLPRLSEIVSVQVPVAPRWFVSELGDEAVAIGAVNHASAAVERRLFAVPEPQTPEPVLLASS